MSLELHILFPDDFEYSGTSFTKSILTSHDLLRAYAALKVATRDWKSVLTMFYFQSKFRKTAKTKKL